MKNLWRVCLLWTMAWSAVSAQPGVEEISVDVTQLSVELNETSGLARYGDSLWTHNDSGDVPRVFELDLQGNILRQVMISNVDNVDWEAMAHDENYLYVADTGNNFNSRSRLVIHRLSWEDLGGDNATAEQIELEYADYESGNRLSHNFDAEGLAVRGDELWLFSKNRGDRQSKLYRFPKLPGSYRPQPSQTLAVASLVTGADIHPESGELVLLSSNGRGETWLWRAPTSDRGVDWDVVRVSRLNPGKQWEAVLWEAVEPTYVYITHENEQDGGAGLARINLAGADPD